VLWRFRALVAIGLCVAALFALISVVRIGGKPFIKYRKAEQYISYATLFVTQPGFPWGQLEAPQSADPGRFTSLAVVYSQLATTDPVRRRLLATGPVQGTVQVAAVLDQTNQEPLPLISIAAFSDSKQGAIDLARRETAALVGYIKNQQQTNAIDAGNRVDVNVVRKAQFAQLVKGRSLALPVVIFLTVLLVFCALAFILENMRPRIRAVQATVPQQQSASDAA
jgi:hypothetical protein